MIVLATPVEMESAWMALMSTNVCAPQDTQVRNFFISSKINLMTNLKNIYKIFISTFSLLGDKCDVNINECNSNPCMSGGTCVDKVNGFHCLCPPKTHGPLCLSGPDHCAVQPCVHGKCIEQQHGYVNLELLLRFGFMF